MLKHIQSIGKPGKVFMLLFLLIFLWGSADAEVIRVGSSAPASQSPAFTLRLEGGVSGYQNNPIHIHAPEAGSLTVEIWDDTTRYRALKADIPAGASTLDWDGLGWNEERMAQKEYRMLGVLAAESGVTYETSARIRVIPAQQAVLFALPSDPDVYLETASDWFLEFRMLFTDEFCAAFLDAETGETVLCTSRQAKGGRVNSISWALLTGRKKLEPGAYRVRTWGGLHPDYVREFTVTVHEGRRPVLPLQVTGDIMPTREDTDEEIWAKMMAPATVIDIRNVSHQRVYAQPDRSSAVLGTLHGQSQSVSVLEIREDWVLVSTWGHEKGQPVEGWVPRGVLKVVQPQGKYGILVDKRAQTLTLFEEGRRVDTLLVSTGRMTKTELYQETAAGSFLTDEHMSDYSTNGLKYDFVIRYDGGNLLHQIPYAWNESGKKEMNPGEMYLGTKASHACIRVQEKPSETGLNAYWFWTHLPYHTRLVVLDDPEERTNLERRVSGTTPDLMEGLGSAWQVASDAEEENRVLITLGGDVVLGGRESYYGDPEGLPAVLDQKGLEWPFAELKELFSADDLTVVNMEGVLKDDSAGEDTTKQWRFRGKTDWAGALALGGIEAVSLANNHTIDYGEAGYESTKKALTGIADYFGNGEVLIREIRGHLFGFGSCRETAYKEDPEIIGRDIRKMKEAGAEFIIYQCHWGTEYEGLHNVLQEAMARACAREGADLVVGHHPHVVQGVDWIDGMPVVYSLGNLMFGGTIRLSTFDGLLCQASFFPDRQENRVEIRLIPVLTSSRAAEKKNDYQPRVAQGADALRILRLVQQDTGWLLTEKTSLEY